MSLEQQIHERRKTFWNDIAKRAKPDTGIASAPELRRRQDEARRASELAEELLKEVRAQEEKEAVDEEKRRQVFIQTLRREQRRQQLESANKALIEQGKTDAGIMASAIDAIVCSEYDVSDELLRSRQRLFVNERNIAMYLIRRLVRPQFSLTHIGRRYSGRDHSTVLHGINTVKRRMESNARFRERIEAIVTRLGGDPK